LSFLAIAHIFWVHAGNIKQTNETYLVYPPQDRALTKEPLQNLDLRNISSLFKRFWFWLTPCSFFIVTGLHEIHQLQNDNERRCGHDMWWPRKCSLACWGRQKRLLSLLFLISLFLSVIYSFLMSYLFISHTPPLVHITSA
jgi:hypothetical protein